MSDPRVRRGEGSAGARARIRARGTGRCPVSADHRSAGRHRLLAKRVDRPDVRQTFASPTRVCWWPTEVRSRQGAVRALLQADPKNPELVYSLALLSLQGNLHSDARNYLQRYLTLIESDPATSATLTRPISISPRSPKTRSNTPRRCSGCARSKAATNTCPRAFARPRARQDETHRRGAQDAARSAAEFARRARAVAARRGATAARVAALRGGLQAARLRRWKSPPTAFRCCTTAR